MANTNTKPEITSRFGIENPLYKTDLKTGKSSYLGEGYVKPQEQTQEPVQPTETQPAPNFQDQKTSTFQPAPVPYTDIQKIEQDKQAQVREPIKQKETPVTLKSGQEVMLNAQEVKMREQNLRNQELQTKTAEKQAKMTDLSNFLANNPDKTSINRYLKINYAPEYRAEYQNTLKAYFKQSDTIKKSQKYSIATPDVIDEAVKSGELIPGTEAYLSLPPEKRQEYEEYATIKQRSELLDPYQAPKTDFTTILESLKSVFSTNYKKDFQDRLNSSEVTQYTKDLENIDTKIADIDKAIKNIEKERAGVAKGVPSSLQRGQNAQDIQALLDEKNTLINQYTAKKSTLDSIKDDINTELEIARIDDENAKQTYMTALSLYNTERSRMDAIEQANFEAESKLRAEERQRDFQKEMLQIQQDFETKNQKGTYQTDREGNLLYITNGVAEKVKQADGTVVGITKEKTFTDTIQKNDDGTFSILRTYENGSKPDLFTYGVNGTNLQNTNLNVWNNISNISDNVGKYSGKVGEYECGEGVNYYLKELGVNDVSMGDTYDTKKDDINSQTPQVGGLAVWNTTPEGKYGENGHVGIVTGYNPENGTVEITDWNSKGDRKKRTYTINVSQINNSDGGFVHLQTSKNNEQGISTQFKEIDIPLYQKFNKGELTSAEYKQIPNLEQFKQEALAYGKKIAEPGYKKIENLITLAESVKGLNQIERLYPDNKTDISRLMSKAGIQELVKLKQGGATFGSLTEKEFERIQESILSVGTLTSDDKWDEILDDYIGTLKMGLPEGYKTSSQVTPQVQTPVQKPQTGSTLDEYKNRPKLDIDNI